MNPAKASTTFETVDPNSDIETALPASDGIYVTVSPIQTQGIRDQTPSPEWIRVQEFALNQLDRFISLEPKVLRGEDPDAIHDLRVASRRLQQVLDLLYPDPAPKEMRRQRRKIRRARRALSEVRNCDVQIERVRKGLARKRISRRPAWEYIRDYLAERRSVTFEAGLHKLAKLNFATVYTRLKSQMAKEIDSASHDGHHHNGLVYPPAQTRTEFYSRLSESTARLYQDYGRLITESRQDTNQRALHAVRIVAKQLRYLVEVTREVGVAGCGEALAWLRRFQQHLGEWHDLEVMEDMLIEMVARPKFLRQHLGLAIEVERIIQQNRAAKEHYVQKYFQMTAESAAEDPFREWIQDLEKKSQNSAEGQ